MNPGLFTRRYLITFLPAWITLLAGLSVSLCIGLWLRDEARRIDQHRFDGLTESARQMIDLVTEKYQHALQQLADSLGKRDPLAQEEWDLAIDTSSFAHGMGLKNMAIRANEAGGEFFLSSKHGAGTEIVVRLARKKADTVSVEEERTLRE